MLEHRLMGDPHCSGDSRSPHHLVAARLPGGCEGWKGVRGLKLVLKQPSPHWLRFGVTQLKCFAEAPEAERGGGVAACGAHAPHVARMFRQLRFIATAAADGRDAGGGASATRRLDELLL